MARKRKVKARVRTHANRLPPGSRASRATVTFTVSLTALPGRQAALEREIRRLIRPTRAEPGCVTYILHRSIDKPRRLFLYEAWANRAALERHWQSPHFLRWKQRQGAVVDTYERCFWDPVA
jgi:quinol monooxygenase YgiN